MVSLHIMHPIVHTLLTFGAKLQKHTYQNTDRFFVWLPLFFILGLTLPTRYQSLPWILMLSILLLSGLSLFMGTLKKCALPLLLFWAGIAYMPLYENFFTTPLLKKSLYLKDFKGRVRHGEHTRHGQQLIVDVLHLSKRSKEAWPKRVSLSLRGKDKKILRPGDIFEAPVKLTPPPGKLAPDGFDFRRFKKFQGVGAVGFIAGKVVPKAPTASPSLIIDLENIRQNIEQFFHQTLPKEQAAIASALITGNTKGIDNTVREAYAHSGIAHLLAISGLHINLVALLLFLMCRVLLSLYPPLLLQISLHKVAAVLAMGGAIFYLFISGMHPPSQRAVIILCLGVIAIICNRNPLSLRMLSFAAFIVLLFNPLLAQSPSFQLSFAAVAALIAGNELGIYPIRWHKEPGIFKRLGGYFINILTTSLIASLAVLPFTLYHFHHLTVHGILANIIAIPLMAFWVLPTLVFGIMLMGTSLGPFFIHLAGLGIEFISQLALFVANMKGARLYFPHHTGWGFILMCIGFYWMIAWRTTWRLWGSLPFFLGLIFMIKSAPLDILVSGDAKYIAVRDEGDMWTSGMRTHTFLNHYWAHYLGISKEKIKRLHDKRHQTSIYNCTQDRCHAQVKDKTVVYLKKNFNPKEEPCPQADIIISQEALKKKGVRCPNANLFLDFFDFYHNGPMGIKINKSKILLKK